MAECSALESICQRLADNDPTLTKVYLYGRRIGNEGIKRVASALVKNTHVTCLYLQQNNIGPEGATVLASKLKFNSSITCINLGGNRVQDEGARALAGMLASSTTALEELILWGNEIGGEGMEHLMEGIQRNTTLKELNVSRNRVGDCGVPPILKYLLRSQSNLRILHLNRNNITSDGVSMLAKGLAVNKSLKVLCLEGNQICNEGLKDLSAALQTNQGLESLFLNSNPIFERGSNSVSELVRIGLAKNFFLRDLCVSYYRQMDAKLVHEMEFYLGLNKSGRRLLRQADAPVTLWAHVMSKAGSSGDPSMISYLLRENPSLVSTGSK